MLIPPLKDWFSDDENSISMHDKHLAIELREGRISYKLLFDRCDFVFKMDC